MNPITVTLPSVRYPIYCESDLLDQLPELLARHQLDESLFLVTDERVAQWYQERVVAALTKNGRAVLCYRTVVGEDAKSARVLDELHTWLIRNGASRRSIILALGGGVIGDLAGFAAATYMRGIRFVQIPTTILAQVDSSIGGKVGINHSLGKNLLGAFHHPQFVLIDPLVLKTLGMREILCGMAEVVKYGCIWDVELFHLLKDKWPEIISLNNPELLSRMLLTCCAIKARVVEADEKESGLRAILNFGHTLGHALESVTAYEYFLHGEAVAHGMRAAAFLSVENGLLSSLDFTEMEKLIAKLNPPVVPHTVNQAVLLAAMQYDKKRSQSGQLWVLLDRIGHAVLSRQVAAEQVLRTLERLLET